MGCVKGAPSPGRESWASPGRCSQGVNEEADGSLWLESRSPCPQDRPLLTASNLIRCAPSKSELQLPTEGPVQALYTPDFDLHYNPTGRHYSLPPVHPPPTHTQGN